MNTPSRPPGNNSEYNGWILIDWDGNPDLGHKCWRKKFSRGHVSVGAGDFDLVAFSYGASAADSYSSTRWVGAPQEGNMVSEQEAMDAVDRGDGKKMVFDNPSPSRRPGF